MSPVRIALVDDQALVLKGLSSLLRDQPGIEVALEATDGGQLLDALPSRPVDVIVSDIRMPGVDGIALVARLRERGDPTPVILLTTFHDDDLLPRALAAGAQGFLLKDASPEDLCAAITRVAAGHTLLQPVSLAPVRHQLAARGTPGTGPSTGGADVHLTEREASLLRLVAGGYSNREIGKALFLSEGTVKNYMSDILAKLDCRDRTQAVLMAITRRLI